MKNTTRLINADALPRTQIVEREKIFKNGRLGMRHVITEVVRVEDLEKAPIVEAVTVVRCKDCKYAIINESHPNKPLVCRLTKMCGTTTPEWYCADGERRNDK